VELRTVKRILISAAWLGFLAVFILIGVPYTSYHGDETTQLYSSHDYATLFIRRDPQALRVGYPTQTELEYLRIADSTTSRYTIGFAWHLAGYSESDLPTANFAWNADYATNQALGLIPDQRLLVVMRLPSALFLAFSTAVIFGIGYCFGGPRMAFFVSGLYVFNPVILLNGRRALQEGSLLFFGLLTVLFGIVIALRRERGRRVPLPLWLGLIVAGALTLVSKNNGFIYIVAAFLWVFLPEMLRPRLRRLISSGIKLAVCGVLLIALFVALSPGLWSDPPTRMKEAALARLSAMTGQMRNDPEAPTSIERRISDILTQPFMRPLAHYEAGFTNTLDGQRDVIAAYDASPISGIHFGALGIPLTGLALFGIVANFLPRLRPYRSPSLSVGVLTWLVINIGVLLWVPLPWQRYFLSLIPIATIFAAVGLWSLVGLVRVRVQSRTLTAVTA
jgi:hypothetical protein